MEGIETRAQLLDSDGLLRQSSDPYIMVREAYFQNHDFIANGGKLKPEENPNAKAIENELKDIGVNKKGEQCSPFLIPARLERVVEVHAVQPGFTFGRELIRTFLEVNFLTVHIRYARINRSILVECIGRTSAQPEAVLIRNRDRAFVCSWYRTIIEGNTGAECPVVIHIVGCPQRDAVSITEALIFIESVSPLLLVAFSSWNWLQLV